MCLVRPRLLLAGRQALPGLHPLQQGGLAVANGPADPNVRGAVAAHASLSEPGHRDIEDLRHVSRMQERVNFART